MLTRKLNIKCLMIIIIMIALVIAPIKGLDILKYLDEILAICAIIVLIKKKGVIISNRYVKNILISLIVICTSGFMSNIVSDINRPIIAIIVDALGVIKNHLIFIAVFIGISSKNKARVLDALLPLVKIYVVICFFCGCLNCVTDTPWEYILYARRFGLRSFQFYYNNPAIIGQVMLIVLAVLDHKSSKMNIYKIMALAVMTFTFRFGIIALVAIYLVITCALRPSSKIRWYHYSLVAIAGLGVGWKMIKEYFLSKITLRYQLMRGGWIIFRQFFPLGSGFATYGSQMSYNFYSPLYYQLGFNNMWGLNAENGAMINDNYWPMLMAQTGIIGLFYGIVLLAQEFKIVMKYVKASNVLRISLTIFSCLAISTVASANLTGIAGTQLYFGLGLLLNKEK